MNFFQYIPPLGSVLLQCTLYMHDSEESDVYAVKDILHKIWPLEHLVYISDSRGWEGRDCPK